MTEEEIELIQKCKKDGFYQQSKFINSYMDLMEV